jgi:hypothetical protein
MALAAEDIEFIKGHLETWLAEKGLAVATQSILDRELFERVVRVEEELRHQRELMQQGFAAIERRFEQVDEHLTELGRSMDRSMAWTFGLTASAVATIIATLRF